MPHRETLGVLHDIVRIDRISPNPDQPRRHFDEDALRGLASSIATTGLLEPLVVRPDPKSPSEDPSYILIAGERRWRALNMIEAVDAPCQIRTGATEQQDYVRSVAENVARSDMTVIEEARAFQRMMDDGLSIEGVARAVGKFRGAKPDTTYIQWRLDLLPLIPELQDLVVKGQLKAKLAWYTARLSPEGQTNVLRRLGRFRTEQEAVEYAESMYAHEAQGALITDGLNQEEREKRAQVRRKAKTDSARVEALSAALGPFLQMAPAELADALEGEVGLFNEKLEILGETVHKVRRNLLRAKSILDVRADSGQGERIADGL